MGDGWATGSSLHVNTHTPALPLAVVGRARWGTIPSSLLVSRKALALAWGAMAGGSWWVGTSRESAVGGGEVLAVERGREEHSPGWPGGPQQEKAGHTHRLWGLGRQVLTDSLGGWLRVRVGTVSWLLRSKHRLLLTGTLTHTPTLGGSHQLVCGSARPIGTPADPC